MPIATSFNHLPVRSWRLGAALLVLAGLGSWAAAEPVLQLGEDPVGERPTLVFETSAALASPDPAEPAGPELIWIGQPSTRFVLDARLAEDRRELLRQPLVDRGPTWMQNASIVNLGDFPSMHNSAANADREISTLVWMIESDRRPLAKTDGMHADEPQEQSWIRVLLPAHWLPTLRANREWVLFSGAVVAGLVWGMALYARRPTSLPPRADSSQYSGLNSSHSTLSGPASTHAPLSAPVPLLRRHRRRRRSHSL